VSCDYSGTLLHAYVDGELDAVRAAEFEQHIESCRECTVALGGAESLRSSLQRAQLYETAPAELRRKVHSEAKVSVGVPRLFPVPLWRWLAVAAAAVVVTALAWQVIPRIRNTDPSQSSPVTSAELIDAHIRSLQPGHLMDVISTDQHTVKPWFDGKLDFIPPVHDFMDEGFPLLGGRLDVLGERNVAAVVYGRRKHYINVFVWPTREPDTTTVHGPGSRQGYQWVHWRHQGMEYCAVSDVNGQDLHELAQLIIQQEDLAHKQASP
jgi:anti-sigma factor RsiW